MVVALRKHAQTLVREADEARIEEELFKEDEDEGDVQCLEYLTVEDSGTFARPMSEQRNLTPIIDSQFLRSSATLRL